MLCKCIPVILSIVTVAPYAAFIKKFLETMFNLLHQYRMCKNVASCMTVGQRFLKMLFSVPLV